MTPPAPSPDYDALLERAARAVAAAGGDGCFERIDLGNCDRGSDCDDCTDHEDARYWRSLARAALTSARVLPPGSDQGRAS